MTYSIALLRSILFWIAFILATCVWTILGVIVSLFSRRGVRVMAHFWACCHRLACRFLLGHTILIEGEMPDGPFLYVFKHESMFEAVDQVFLFHHPAVFAKAELFEIPLWGRVARLYGLIPVNREGGARAMRLMRANARKVRDAGRPLCLFAEGTRVARGESPPLRAGFAGIYSMLDIPVIPVAIDSGRAYPSHRWVKWPGTITYKVGATIPPGLARGEVEARVHAAINALN